MTILSYVTRTPLSPESGVVGVRLDDVLRHILAQKDTLIQNLKNGIDGEVKPQLEAMASRYGLQIPWSEVLARLADMDFETHLSQARAALESLQTARALFNATASYPSSSHEKLATMKELDQARVELISGLMLPPGVDRQGAIYFGYVIYGSDSNVTLFEEMEELLPDAGYRALIPPGPPKSEESREFFPTPKRCLTSLAEFKDAVKKYLVFDRGFRDKSAYSVQVKIAGVVLDLELWLQWEPKRVEIRKHMSQGASLPPSKVIDHLERDEELEVVAVRIPRWLRGKLETDAKSREEQLGTYLRERLEHLYT